MLLTSTTTWLSLFILGVSALFFARIRAYFFTNNKPTITLPVCFIPVSLPVHIPNLHNMVFQPDTILSPDSFPFWFLPIDHLLILPDILHSEILYQSISLMIISHISCYNCCNLIFLLSFCHSPFIYRSCKDALNQGPPFESLLASPANFRLRLTDFLLVYYLQVRATLLSLGKQSKTLPSKVLMHSALIQIFLSRLFPFFLGWCCFECCI